MQKILRINKGCKYFPCHKGLEDCTFCYCPFYPCRNDEFGKYLPSKGKIRHIWSCKNCSWIHRKNIVDNILKQVKRGNINPYKNDWKFKIKDVGIIILGHGSRRRNANRTMRGIIKEARRSCGTKVIEPAYLQLSQPSFSAAVRKIVEKGHRKIVVVPFFLFKGNHVARDIPKEIKREVKRYKDVEFIYSKTLGVDYRMSDIVFDCIKEAL